VVRQAAAVSCSDVIDRELLERSVHDELGEEERSALDVHVLECARCHEDLRSLLALRGALSRTSRVQARPATRWWLPAAIAAAILVVAAAAWMLSRS
jgi:hypothetical protein